MLLNFIMGHWLTTVPENSRPAYSALLSRKPEATVKLTKIELVIQASQKAQWQVLHTARERTFSQF